jgi:hypothetical protein
MTSRFALVPLLLLGVACSSSGAPPSADKSDDAGTLGDAAAATALSGEDCRIPAQSNLDGVTIRFTASPLKCTFTLAEVAAGIDVPYEISIAHDVAATVPGIHACTSPDASGLAPYESVDGAGQHYGIDDTGLCQPQTQKVTIKAGTYPHSFHWDGRNWTGPSDFGQPEGAAFPVGAYVLSVDAAGTIGAVSDGGDGGTATPYDVVAKMHVQIVP